LEEHQGEIFLFQDSQCGAFAGLIHADFSFPDSGTVLSFDSETLGLSETENSCDRDSGHGVPESREEIERGD
jgi:hypothetical protein